MSEARSLLVETADRLFGDLGSNADIGVTWPKIAGVGLPDLLLPEEGGGFGGDWGDLFAVCRLAGRHAVAAPVGEAVVAVWALAKAGLEPVQGRVTLAPSIQGSFSGNRFSGLLAGVPFGAEADIVVASLGDDVIRLRIKDAQVTKGVSPAGEPRDTLRFSDASVDRSTSRIDIFAYGALVRTAQIAGALDEALSASISYANDRMQFGKAIAKFQAVQQILAVFAVEAAAVNAAGQAAARAADAGDASFEFAAAKLRANGAAGQGAAIAHQVHGAIGFTREYPLHRLTRRLIGWRSEFGGDQLWAERLGRRVADLGAEGLWPELARRSDAAQ